MMTTEGWDLTSAQALEKRCHELAAVEGIPTSILTDIRRRAGGWNGLALALNAVRWQLGPMDSPFSPEECAHIAEVLQQAGEEELARRCTEAAARRFAAEGAKAYDLLHQGRVAKYGEPPVAGSELEAQTAMSWLSFLGPKVARVLARAERA